MSKSGVYMLITMFIMGAGGFVLCITSPGYVQGALVPISESAYQAFCPPEQLPGMVNCARFLLPLFAVCAIFPFVAVIGHKRGWFVV